MYLQKLETYMRKVFGFLLAGIAGGLVVLGGNYFMQKASPSNDLADTKSSSASGFKHVDYMPGGGTYPSSFIKASEAAMPTVVHIEAKQTAAEPRTERERRYYHFFGEPQPRQSTGSGVIINKEGFIVTNNHVVENANQLEVTLYDQKKYKATLVGTDPSTDLAVLKIEAEGLIPVEFADSDEAKVGEWVLAVGNPFNLTSTVTAGIISAKGRNLDLINGQRAIESFIQTDAAVNPGNSGGALVNSDGKLLGINTAIFAPNGTYAGYSFAVPINLVKKVVSDLINYGSVHRGMLGVVIADLNAEVAKEESLSISQGVYVVELSGDGGAKKAGIKEGDVIVAVDGKNVKTVNELQEKIASRNPGDLVSVTINRRGSQKDYRVELKE